MVIRLAEHSGFCFGVKRAIKIALEASKKQHPVYTSGALIHSPQMVEELIKHGVFIAENPTMLKNSIIIIRSHGIPAPEKEKLIQQGNILIDATCPFVTKAQEIIQQLCEEGYTIFIMGDPHHPEVIAMQSYCSQETFVVERITDIPSSTWQKIGIISQTTKSIEQFQEIIAALLPKAKELRIYNTICTATSLRQKASLSLAKQSDLMVVIGGYNSSNTRMLATLCSEITQTIHVETATDLKPEDFIGKNRIGLTAGASTPDFLIVEVFNKISEITGSQTTVKSVKDVPV